MKRILLSVAALLALTFSAKALDDTMNPLITAMPSLTIAPDARAAGQGDIGVATSADQNSQFWNPAKFAYLESHGGITANYTPWLRKLVGDIDLAHLEGFYKWDDIQGIAGSFTYFSMGKVSLTDEHATEIGTCSPNEWALDVSYYRRLHEYVSMSVALRFLYSDIANGSNTTVSSTFQDYKAAWTMAADIGLYYQQPFDIKTGTSYFRLGFTLKNLGGKMSYKTDGSSNFIPASMNIGATYEIPCDKYNKLTFGVEANKLLVPSRLSKFAKGEDPNDPYRMSQDEWNNLSSVKGMFWSFADAPGGAKEEFNEVSWGVGAEYTYNRQFFARLGYRYENYYKGNRNYFTVGAGFHLSIVTVDVSYCVATAASNPLDQTLRFTLGFDLAGIKDLVDNRKK
ncbi:MAG: type IX secretion system outer membrane channel protein PorV [Paludibacteraceae bacterium]|nr:type IX secretion system outer membrane channel protein PorV [Paludibacteraceae bacterium]